MKKKIEIIVLMMLCFAGAVWETSASDSIKYLETSKLVKVLQKNKKTDYIYGLAGFSVDDEDDVRFGPAMDKYESVEIKKLNEAGAKFYIEDSCEIKNRLLRVSKTYHNFQMRFKLRTKDSSLAYDVKFMEAEDSSTYKSNISSEQRRANSDAGLGYYSDEELDAQRKKNFENGAGSLVDNEVYNQRKANEAKGLGKYTDYELECKTRNIAAGLGDFTDGQLKLQRENNEKNGFGKTTDAELYAQRLNNGKVRGFFASDAELSDVPDWAAFEKQALDFEKEGKLIHAMDAWWHVMYAGDSSVREKAYENFKRIGKQIESGYPESGVEYDDFSIYKRWCELKEEWVSVRTPEFMYRISPVSFLKTENDYENETCSFEYKVLMVYSEEYKLISSYLFNGFRIVSRNDWTMFKEQNGVYFDSSRVRSLNEDALTKTAKLKAVLVDKEDRILPASEYVLQDKILHFNDNDHQRGYQLHGYILKFTGISQNISEQIGREKITPVIIDGTVSYVDPKSYDPKSSSNVKYYAHTLSMMELSMNDLQLAETVQIAVNEKNGLGAISDKQVETERKINKEKYGFELTKFEAETQIEKNEKNGDGEFIDAVVKKQRAVNSAKGFGSVSDLKADREREENKKAGKGSFTNFEMKTMAEAKKKLGQSFLQTDFVNVNMASGPVKVQVEEVSQDLFKTVMGYVPDFWTDGSMPVNGVSLKEAVTFCNKLSIIFGRKPRYYFNNDFNPGKFNKLYSDTFNYDVEANGFTLPEEKLFRLLMNNTAGEVVLSGDAHVVSSGEKNSLGVRNIRGNVMEWIEDTVMFNGYHTYGLLMGGSWCDERKEVHVDDAKVCKDFGFRVVLMK